MSEHIVIKRIAAGMCLLLLAGCRLVITTDEGGYITSASGSAGCNQPSCEITIEDEFTDTFTAVPAPGYRFAGWTGVCKRSVTEVCELYLVALTGQYAVFDGDVQMSARFESTAQQRPWYRDADGDNYGSATRSRMAFEKPAGFVYNKLDCNDGDANVYPHAPEQADEKDNDCDGRIDEGIKPPADEPAEEPVDEPVEEPVDDEPQQTSERYYRDVDGDGYGRSAGSTMSTEPLNGYVLNRNDCDDNNASIFPGASEEFDSVDNDCDGRVDEGFSATTYYRDVDGDGYGDSSNTVFELERPPGYALRGGDNCVNVSNANQADQDNDGIGDVCDSFTDSDRDGDRDSNDNCPTVYNPNQADIDNDNIGDACDSVDDRDTGGNQGGGCSPSALDQSMLDAVNAVRAQARECGVYGWHEAVAPLSWSCELETAAAGHSQDMAVNGYFSHDGLNGSTVGTRATQAGYSWSTVGENIAAGGVYNAVGAVVQAWVDSDGHCANLMRSSFTQLGAARYTLQGSPYNVYWTQVFGRPR